MERDRKLTLLLSLALALAGCGDSNSKHFLCGDVEVARRLGCYLGQTYVKVARRLAASARNDLALMCRKTSIPFAPLPSVRALTRDLRELDDFMARAEQGDENTIECVGLNFPRALSPVYRGKLVLPVRAWVRWALDVREGGALGDVPTRVDIPVHALRVGDVGIVGLPCEAFLGIGRQVKASTPLPVTVTCGYVNASCGYVTDAPNTGDREYMSSFCRYTEYWPPYRRPAGDVLARTGVRMLREMG
jgi:hypothetical protein